jgi:hypothetical protein
MQLRKVKSTSAVDSWNAVVMPCPKYLFRTSFSALRALAICGFIVPVCGIRAMTSAGGTSKEPSWVAPLAERWFPIKGLAFFLTSRHHDPSAPPRSRTAGGQHVDGVTDLGCRILVVFKGAGFDFSFGSSSSLPVCQSLFTAAIMPHSNTSHCDSKLHVTPCN